jgi:hypothetical protein
LVLRWKTQKQQTAKAKNAMPPTLVAMARLVGPFWFRPDQPISDSDPPRNARK